MRRVSSLALGALPAVLAAAFTFTVGSGSAYGQASDCPPAYPPSPCGELQVSSNRVAPGDRLRVSGDGFAPGSSVSIDLYSHVTRLADVTTDRSGSFATSVTIPSDTTPGRHRLVASGQDPSGAPRTLATAITVTDSRAKGPKKDSAEGETSEIRAAEAETSAGSSGTGGAAKARASGQRSNGGRARSGGDELPSTGPSSAGELAAVAAGLVAVGGGLLLVRRRRGPLSS